MLRQLRTRNSENSGIAAAPTPCQRMRFSAEPAKGCGSRRVNWIGRQTDKRPRIIDASQNWVGNGTPRRNQYHRPCSVGVKLLFVGSLSSLLLPQNRRCRREWKTRDPKTFNVQPFPKMRNDKEHRCEIEQPRWSVGAWYRTMSAKHFKDKSSV